MFDTLRSLPFSTLVIGSHSAILWLRNIGTTLSTHDEATQTILQEVENDAHKPIAALSITERTVYEFALATFVDYRARHDYARWTDPADSELARIRPSANAKADSITLLGVEEIEIASHAIRVLARLELWDEANVLADRCASSAALISDVAVVQLVATVLVDLGSYILRADMPEQALKYFERVLTTYSDLDISTVQEQVAKALLNRGVALNRLERYVDELTAYERTIATFASNSSAVVRDIVARAQLNRAIHFCQSSQFPSAIATLEVVLRTPIADVSIEVYGKALLTKAFAVGSMGDKTAELQMYDEAINTLRPHLIEYPDLLARAMFNKAVAFGDIDNRIAEINAYDELIALFDAHARSDVQRQVKNAENNRAIALRQIFVTEFPFPRRHSRISLSLIEPDS